MAQLPKLLSTFEYAEKWGVSKATVVHWCKSGKLDRCQYVGNRMWVIAHDAVRRSRIGPKEMRLLNELSNVNPLTGLEKAGYVAPPARRKGKKNYVLPMLEYFRLELGWNKSDLERISGVHRDTITRAEKGIGVQAHNVRRLADGLEVSVSQLLQEGP